jgi:AcrR family transcriptional regulator
MPADPRRRRAARHAQPATAAEQAPRRKPPITVDRITDAALEVVATQGYDALTMRSVAAVLDTGPASLYAHVVNKADLDELLIGYLCSRIVLPEPDPETWREQIFDLAAQIRDQYLRYPGISQAALGVVPSNPEALRLSEGMLGILLAGGVSPQTAAWAIDALSLYVNAYCLEIGLWMRQMDTDGGWVVTHDTLMGRFEALSDDDFPLTKRYAAELTAGEGHDRFDFAMRTMINGLGGHP